MTRLIESLQANDLQHLVKKVFEIDSFESKIGEDHDVVVLSFTVDSEDPAKDLENFIEMGYDFVLDADCSPGETDDGKYRVYVEIERTRHAPDQIFEILEGIEKLTGMSDMRFRYFKSFKSYEATLENLKSIVPINKNTYNIATERGMLENFTNFFKNSYLDELTVIDESINFKRAWANPVSFNIITSGPKQEVYNQVHGPILLESKDIAEVMFLTKVIGNYNITKIGNAFIFENNGWAVALERK
jgi:hypothetical protein